MGHPTMQENDTAKLTPTISLLYVPKGKAQMTIYPVKTLSSL